MATHTRDHYSKWTSHFQAALHFNQIDQNKDSSISMDETMNYLGLSMTNAGRFLAGNANFEKFQNLDWFEKMDKNGDGTIQPEEFDEDLGRLYKLDN